MRPNPQEELFPKRVRDFVRGMQELDPSITASLHDMDGGSRKVTFTVMGREYPYEFKLARKVMKIGPVGGHPSALIHVMDGEVMEPRHCLVLEGLVARHYLLTAATPADVCAEEAPYDEEDVELGPNSEFIGDPDGITTVVDLGTQNIWTTIGPNEWRSTLVAKLHKGNGYHLALMQGGSRRIEGEGPGVMGGTPLIALTVPCGALQPHDFVADNRNTALERQRQRLQRREMVQRLAQLLTEKGVEIEELDNRVLTLGMDNISVPLGPTSADTAVITPVVGGHDFDIRLQTSISLTASNCGTLGKLLSIMDGMTLSKLRKITQWKLVQGKEAEPLTVGVDLV